MGTEILGYADRGGRRTATQPREHAAATATRGGVALVCDMLIRCADRGFETLSGYSADELDDTPLACYLAPLPDAAGFATIWNVHTACEEPSSYGAMFLCKDGRRMPVDVHVRPMRQNGSRLELVELEPIADDVNSDDSAEAAEDLTTLGAMIKHIAHDFNNIFQRILGPADLLMVLAEPDERERKCLSQIIYGCKKGGSVIRSLQTFTQQDGIVREMINIQDAVETVSKKLARATPDDVVVTLQIPETLWPVEADADQMARALMELGANAAEAVGDAGHIVFEAHNVGSADVSGRHVAISVTDDGPGIDDAIRQRVFRPFFTTKAGGEHSGLGLTVARSIVEAHDGAIELRSRSDGGTAFTILLPAGTPAGAALDAERSALRTISGDGSARILVVEDDETVSWTTCRVLEMAGHTAIPAFSGDQAVDTYREQMGSIDLVLLDLVMPGMSGEECLEHIRALNAAASVVIASGSLTDDARRRRLADDVIGYIGKPYDANSLLEIVHGALAAGDR